jgi:hypothetical protein
VERTYLQWNLPNFLTVLIMAAVGLTVFGAMASFVSGRMKSGDDTQ